MVTKYILMIYCKKVCETCILKISMNCASNCYYSESIILCMDIANIKNRLWTFFKGLKDIESNFRKISDNWKLQHFFFYPQTGWFVETQFPGNTFLDLLSIRRSRLVFFNKSLICSLTLCRRGFFHCFWSFGFGERHLKG